MATLEWIRFIIGTGLLLLGLITFAFELFGAFKLDYVLNRMQIAAMGDTLGIGISLLGLIVLSGFNFTSLKFLLVIIFLWCSSPVSSHLIARLEVFTYPKLAQHCDVPEQLKKELGNDENDDTKLESFADIMNEEV